MAAVRLRRGVRIGSAAFVALLWLAIPSPAGAAEPDELIEARRAYNEGDYDAAIAAAAAARQRAGFADPAALVQARAYLERFRADSHAGDLSAAHAALAAVRAPQLSPRDYVDLLVGLGQYLFLTDAFGAARGLFDSALAQSYLLSARDRMLLLDWWANAMERSAQTRPAGARAAVFRELLEGMEQELQRDPGSHVANYWLPVAAQGAGDLERAWEASMAGWVRAALDPASTARLRADLDRFVTQALIPALAVSRGASTATDEALKAQREAWASFTATWTTGAVSHEGEPNQ